jgi:hypothetical protein
MISPASKRNRRRCLSSVLASPRLPSRLPRQRAVRACKIRLASLRCLLEPMSRQHADKRVWVPSRLNVQFQVEDLPSFVSSCCHRRLVGLQVYCDRLFDHSVNCRGDRKPLSLLITPRAYPLTRDRPAPSGVNGEQCRVVSLQEVQVTPPYDPRSSCTVRLLDDSKRSLPFCSRCRIYLK